MALLYPGADDRLYHVLAEGSDEPLARLVRLDEPMLLEHGEIPVRGAYADLQPLRHRRGADLAALEHGDEYLLLPLRDVHARHAVRVPARRRPRLHGIRLRRGPVGIAHRDCRHRAAADVVLDGQCSSRLLRRGPGHAETSADATDLLEHLCRCPAEAEFHGPVLVLDAGSPIRDADHVSALEHGDDHAFVVGVYEVLHDLPYRLLGDVAPELADLAHNGSRELGSGRVRVRGGYLRDLGI